MTESDIIKNHSEQLTKYGWVKVKQNTTDQIWRKNDIIYVRGSYSLGFYLEVLKNGVLLDVGDKKRETIIFKSYDEIYNAIMFCESDFNLRISEIRDMKLKELGI